MIYKIDITNIDKELAKKIKFLCKLTGCEAQKGREETISFGRVRYEVLIAICICSLSCIE